MHKTSHHQRYGVMILIGLGFAVLLGFTLYYIYGQIRVAANQTIADDIENLSRIISSIDNDCEIMEIMRDRSYIDFLQISNFTGPQVGPFQLRHPEKWHGPYVEKNPTVQSKLYEIVKVHEGYAIVPGEGVKLSNGKVMGQDIVITATSDIDAYVNDTVGLEFRGKPLAARIQLRHTRVNPPSIALTDAGA